MRLCQNRILTQPPIRQNYSLFTYTGRRNLREDCGVKEQGVRGWRRRGKGKSHGVAKETDEEEGCRHPRIHGVRRRRAGIRTPKGCRSIFQSPQEEGFSYRACGPPQEWRSLPGIARPESRRMQPIPFSLLTPRRSVSLLAIQTRSRRSHRQAIASVHPLHFPTSQTGGLWPRP